jgi:hypothetical protein
LPCRSVPFKREESPNRVGAQNIPQNIPTMEGMEIMNSKTRTVSLYLATRYQVKITHVDYLLEDSHSGDSFQIQLFPLTSWCCYQDQTTKCHLSCT